MIEKVFTVTPKLGMHARPAALFVQATTQFSSSVRVIRGAQEVDGKSIMGLMMLAAEKGAKLKVIIEGDDEKDLLNSLTELFASKFDEE